MFNIYFFPSQKNKINKTFSFLFNVGLFAHTYILIARKHAQLYFLLKGCEQCELTNIDEGYSLWLESK